MNYSQIVAEARKRYDGFAATYRKLDDTDTDRELRSHYGRVLRRLSSSFDRQISVLDLGCGTGRYFHCLEQVERLTGVDVSPRMLEEARRPFRQERVAAGRIELICGNLFEQRFPLASFDLIYSIGVLGEYAPLDLQLCQTVFEWLKPGGIFFFTIVDEAFRPSKSPKRSIAEWLYPFLPFAWKAKIRQERLWRSLHMTDQQIGLILEHSAFELCGISRFVSSNPHGWQGAHFECTALKPEYTKTASCFAAPETGHGSLCVT